VNKDKQPAKPANPTAGGATSDHAVHNPALGEIYQKLYPEMKRPKPSQEAIAAALQAMQNLASEADAEEGLEESAIDPMSAAGASACTVCGHPNREGNKFCGMCGLPVESSGQAGASFAGAESPAMPGAVPRSPATGSHHYHHHYHHHYFSGGYETPVSRSAPNPESLRETDKMRVAAAAKGEPMSRSEASVRRVTQEWVLACNTRQLDELLDLYAADALILRSNHPPVRGAAAVREFFFSALDSGLGEVEVEPLRVEVAGDLAHEVGRYSALVPGTTGKRREERGKYLWVFAKQSGGEWKLVSDCWSSDLTLPGAESDFSKPAGPPLVKTAPRRGA